MMKKVLEHDQAFYYSPPRGILWSTLNLSLLKAAAAAQHATLSKRKRQKKNSRLM